MILSWILLVLSIPIGLWIAHLARDELISGRTWFVCIAIASFVFGTYFVYKENDALSFTLASMLIISLISYTLSYNKKWAKKAFK